MTRRRPPGRLWPLPIEKEVDEELAAHIELQVKRFMDGGMSEAEARAAALRRFGDVAHIRDECRGIRRKMEVDMRRAELRQELRMDAVFTIRTLRKSPAFLLVALLTIALAVGANTAIFSVVHAVLLRPLPYRHAERTVVLWNSYAPGGSSYTSVAAPEYF